ncbi:integrase, catalytic region, zinc finger, CCHC-type containing protein, partial [Tanacetum coccineum]
NSKDISTMSYVDLYTHLKSYKQQAMKTLNKMNQTSRNADPLAYMAQATHSTSSPSQYVPPPPQSCTYPLRVYDSKETLIQAEVSRTKMLERMKDPLCKVSSKPINYAKLNSLYDTFVPQKQLSREQVYWLPANEVASYNCNQYKLITNFVRTCPAKSQVNTQLKMLKACFLEFDKVVKDRTTPSYLTYREWHFEHTQKCFVEEIIPFYERLKMHVRGIEDNLFKEVSKYMKIFDELDKEYDQCVINKKSLEIANKNLLIQNECLLVESVSKDICSVVLTSDIVVPMTVKPRSNCVEEHSRNLELEAEILTVKQLLVEKEKRCSFIETKYQELELKFQKYKECFENPQVCNNSSSPELNVFFEISKLKDQLQGKDELIRKLKAQIGIKSVTEASKSKSKCETKTHRNLPARSENVKRVDNPLRNLNKRNHVDSSLSVKRRKFTLGDTCPLTRITKPKVVPLEKLGSVSTSKPANNVIVTPRFSKKPLTSHKRKDRKLKDISTGSPPNTEIKAVNDPVNVIQIVLWYLDSDCSRHMTGDRSKLIDYVDKFIGLEVAFRKYTCYIRNKDKVDLLKASSMKSWLWHRRLNHLNFKTLNELTQKDLVRGLPKLKYKKEHLCPSCQLGKSKKSSHPLKTVNTNTEVLKTLHMNLCGLMRVESINRKKYILVIVEDYTRFG